VGISQAGEYKDRPNGQWFPKNPLSSLNLEPDHSILLIYYLD